MLELTLTYFLGLTSPFADTVCVRSCRSTRPAWTAITPRFRANRLYPTAEEIPTATRPANKSFFFVVILLWLPPFCGCTISRLLLCAHLHSLCSCPVYTK